LSIAFVLAVVTSAVPKATLFAVFSGLAKGLSEAKLNPFIANMHVALWALAAVSVLGSFVCLLRPRHDEAGVEPTPERADERPLASQLDGLPVPAPAQAAPAPEPAPVGGGR
jgi:hypothetical protein